MKKIMISLWIILGVWILSGCATQEVVTEPVQDNSEAALEQFDNEAMELIQGLDQEEIERLKGTGTPIN